jgi:hypothetical protein
MIQALRLGGDRESSAGLMGVEITSSEILLVDMFLF